MKYANNPNGINYVVKNKVGKVKEGYWLIEGPDGQREEITVHHLSAYQRHQLKPYKFISYRPFKEL